MKYDVLIVGAGASGMMAAIAAASSDRKVVLCEHMKKPGLKILASGGKRCNFTNTLSHTEFMDAFGKYGRFMEPALSLMGSEKLRAFFSKIGVESDAPDGFRVWPKTHNSETILEALKKQLNSKNVTLLTETRVLEITPNPDGTFLIKTNKGDYMADKVIVASGGMSYKSLGATGDGYLFAEAAGHKVKEPVPAGVGLLVKEKWPRKMTAHTIGKAHLQVDIKKHTNLKRQGDLIFTPTGIAGPVTLDISGDISLLLTQHAEVPILMNLCADKTKQDWQRIFKQWRAAGQSSECLTSLLRDHFPLPLCNAFCEMIPVSSASLLKDLSGNDLDTLCNLLTRTPLTVVGTEGFDAAFVTRGGIDLKKVDPHTLESRLQKGLFFCGEVLDLDGPCGGFNLQWAFASGYLAGQVNATD